jgi:hypothetical protein
MTSAYLKLAGLRWLGGFTAIAGLLLISACSTPTAGPTVRINEQGWEADPAVIVQPGEAFTLTLVNELDSPVSFVLVQVNYGDVDELPLVDGVVDVSRQVLYEIDDPTVASPPVVAYYTVHPGVEGEGAVGWSPDVLEPGETKKLTIGDPSKGGGGPGAYVVISHEPGGLGRGDYAAFDLTDKNGKVPMMSIEDFFGVEETVGLLEAGDQLPPWQGSLLGGGTFDSHALTGPSLILLFWDGQPEAAEILSTFQAALDQNDTGIEGVIVDTFDTADAERLQRLIEDIGIDAPIVIDETGDLELVFGVGAEDPPYWIMIDTDGKVTWAEYGPRSAEEIRSMIEG